MPLTPFELPNYEKHPCIYSKSQVRMHTRTCVRVSTTVLHYFYTHFKEGFSYVHIARESIIYYNLNLLIFTIQLVRE